MINVSNGFNSVANGSVRPLVGGVHISWDKNRDDTINWFVLDQSELDGGDILAQDISDPIQFWDSYDYVRETDRLIKQEWSRSVEFPYNVQTALASFSLNNYDGRYTYNGSSDIAQNVLPKRPVRLYAGFKVNGASEVIPQFVGMTENCPTYSGTANNIATFTASDFMSQIADFKLTQTIMSQNVRTDQAIEIILQQFGLEPTMYSLEPGVNVIPFYYLEKGKDAGNALKKLIQAENGRLWLDEKGIVRFMPRTAYIGQTPVMQFNDSNIISAKASGTSGIVNTVHIESEIRRVMDNQQVYTMTNELGWQNADDDYRVRANGVLEVWASFDDPLWTGNVSPTLNGSDDDSMFNAVDLTGNSVNSGVSITGTLFADSAKLEISNINNFPVSISFISLWGEPAKVADVIEYQAYDDESVEKFGSQSIEITDNPFFGSYNNADSYGEYIISKRKDYNSSLELKVKGNPALQLGDIVEVINENAVQSDYNYTVVGIKHSLDNKGLKTSLTVEYFGALMSPFILNVSVLDGTDVLG